MSGIIHNILGNARRELLDVSARNRLVNTPLHQARSKSIEIIDELSEEVFRILGRDGKAMSFLPAQESRQLTLSAARIGPAPEVGADHDADPPLLLQPDDDELIAPRDTIHVVDANSSQALAIEEVRRGRHLVIQGPPGTGKSQTITNLIAMAVRHVLQSVLERPRLVDDRGSRLSPLYWIVERRAIRSVISLTSPPTAS